MGRIRTQQHLAQAVPEKRTFRHLYGKHRETLGDAVFGILAQLVAVHGDAAEDAKDRITIDVRRRFIQVEAAMFKKKIRAGNRRPLASKLLVERASRWRKIVDEQRRAA